MKKNQFWRKINQRFLNNQLPLTHTSQVADPCLLSKPLKNQSYEADSFEDYPIWTHSLLVLGLRMQPMRASMAPNTD